MGLVQEVCNYAIDYVEIIRKQGNLSKDLEGDQFREVMQKSDEARRRKHNTLIDSINIANRYILKNFESYTTDPINIDTSNRDIVKDWAIRLVRELSK